MTKVLKLKDKKRVQELVFKREAGEQKYWIPIVDANGDYVLDLRILEDEAFSDLHEHILDLCELGEYGEAFSPVLPDQETPIKQPKGDFSRIKQGKSIEEAVEEYYNGKKGTVTKVLEFFGL